MNNEQLTLVEATKSKPAHFSRPISELVREWLCTNHNNKLMACDSGSERWVHMDSMKVALND